MVGAATSIKPNPTFKPNVSSASSTLNSAKTLLHIDFDGELIIPCGVVVELYGPDDDRTRLEIGTDSFTSNT